MKQNDFAVVVVDSLASFERSLFFGVTSKRIQLIMFKICNVCQVMKYPLKNGRTYYKCNREARIKIQGAMP